MTPSPRAARTGEERSTPLLIKIPRHELARRAFGRADIRRRRLEDILPGLPLDLVRHALERALEAGMAIVAAAPLPVARPEPAAQPQAEGLAIRGAEWVRCPGPRGGRRVRLYPIRFEKLALVGTSLLWGAVRYSVAIEGIVLQNDFGPRSEEHFL